MIPVKKIDIHTHVIEEKGIPTPKGNTMLTPDEQIAALDALGVEKSVLLPIASPEGQMQPITNPEIMRVVKKHPDRFYWFCNVDPRSGNNTPRTDFVHFLSYYKALGAKGVGEITANIDMDNPRVDALFAACEQLNMPVTIHIGAPDISYGLIDPLGLPKLERALQKFPKLKILGHSQKFWSEISSDVTEETRNSYPTGPVTPGRVVELMRKYPNLLGDLSAGSGYAAMKRDPEFAYAFMEEFQDRLLYGTDICAIGQVESYKNGLMRFMEQGVEAGKLSYTAYEKICRLNALKLLEGN